MPIVYGIGAFIGSLFARFFTAGTLSWMFVGFSVLPYLVSKIVSLLGFTTIILVGLNYLTDKLLSYLLLRVGDLPSDVFAMLGIMQLDVAFSLLISTGVTKQIFNGIFNGKKKNTVWNPPEGSRNGLPGDPPFPGGRKF